MKLDRSWIAGIDHDPARQALVAGLSHFSRATGCRLIAEGVETREPLGAASLRGRARPGLPVRPAPAPFGVTPRSADDWELTLDGVDDLGGLGRDLRREARDDVAVRRHEELLEVPADVAGVALGVGVWVSSRVERVAARRR